MKPELTLEEQLDKAREAYKTYYKANRKHLCYAEVKKTVSAMLEKIARLEYLVEHK